MRRHYLTLAATLGIASPAPAQPADDIYFAFRWAIGASEAVEEPFWVKEQGLIAETNYYPEEMWEAETDIIGAGGQMIVPKGGQLIATDSHMRIICTFDYTPNVGYLSSRRRVCLVDEDRDGNFDTHYELNVTSGGFVMMSGRIKGSRKPLQSIALKSADPFKMVGAPYLALHYERILDADNVIIRQLEKNAESDLPPRTVIRFFTEVGRKGGKLSRVGIPCGDDSKGCASGDLPSEYSIWGMKIRVLERRKEDLLIKIEEGFKYQAKSS